MKEYILFTCLLFACCNLYAQNACEELQQIHSDFQGTSKAFDTIQNVTDAGWGAYTSQFLKTIAGIEAKSTGDIAKGMLLTTYAKYIDELYKRAKYNEIEAAGTRAFELLKKIPTDEKSYPFSCRGINRSYDFTQGQIYFACDLLLSEMATATILNKGGNGSYYFTWALRKNFLNQSARSTNIAAGVVLQNRAEKAIFDDTTFYAAFEFVRTFYTINSLYYTFKSRSEDETYKIAIDALARDEYVKMHIPAIIPNAYQVVYADTLEKPAMYLLCYMKIQQDSTLPPEHKLMLLKKALQTYEANGKSGYPFLGTLSFTAAVPNEYNCVTFTQSVINNSDKELMERLANTFAGFSKNNYIWYEYCAHLLYHALGQDNKAKKMYNTIHKNDKEWLLNEKHLGPVY
ncbi:MAG TPA: hypothetical protein VG738_19970 [Chitinophagaceae bacterium]|nr:hypothetical protein [Chitinophagaceae bacterium]